MWSDVMRVKVYGEGVVRGRVVGVGANDVLVDEDVGRCAGAGGYKGKWALEVESAALVLGVDEIVVEGAPGDQ